jgi:hypothetical protein
MNAKFWKFNFNFIILVERLVGIPAYITVTKKEIPIEYTLLAMF